MVARQKCAVSELERQILAAMTVEDAAEKRLQATPEGPARIGAQMEVDAARTIARELLEEQLSAIARSEHGVVLQLIQRYRAIDAGDMDTADRLERHIRQGVDTIELALGARLTALG
ncbi:MAG: hypothetical protein WCF81_03060 [Roseiarcus sp.]